MSQSSKHAVLVVEALDDAADKRRSQRIPRRLAVWVETRERELFETTTLDVSDDGACLHGSGLPIQIGDCVRMCLMRSSAMHEQWIHADVRWRTADRIGVELRTPVKARKL